MTRCSNTDEQEQGVTTGYTFTLPYPASSKSNSLGCTQKTVAKAGCTSGCMTVCRGPRQLAIQRGKLQDWPWQLSLSTAQPHEVPHMQSCLAGRGFTVSCQSAVRQLTTRNKGHGHDITPHACSTSATLQVPRQATTDEGDHQYTEPL